MTFHFVESERNLIHFYSSPGVSSPGVVHVEIDSEVSMGTGSSLYNLQKNPTWHLDRVDQRDSKLNGKYFSHVSGGSVVRNYILDTGIDIRHPEFEGRARWGANFADDQGPDGCLESHGTHVAGIIGSKTYGVAKKTNLISVKVLDCSGSGSTSGVIRGIEYAVNDSTGHTNDHNNAKVINLSLGGGLSVALNRAVKEATKAGIFVVAAAGNENADACGSSPASEPSVITVGAFERGDRISWFSNFGRCVDLFAPGSEIKSTVPGGGAEVLDGTSQASPIVAGIVSLVLSSSKKAFTPCEMKEFLSAASTQNRLSGNLYGSPNKIIFSLAM
jgi:serine protease